MALRTFANFDGVTAVYWHNEESVHSENVNTHVETIFVAVTDHQREI